MRVDVGKIDLTLLNQALIPLQVMEIKPGHLDKFSLDATANRDSAVGEALMTYRNLQVNFLKLAEPDRNRRCPECCPAG